MLHRKRLEFQHLVAVEIGHRDFRRGDQPVIRALKLEKVFLEFGQLASAEKTGGIDHEGWQDFRISVLARVHIQHEIGERPFQLGAHSRVDGKARAGDFGGALEIQNSERRAQVPMRLGFEIEWRGVPQRRTSWLSAALRPTGTLECGMLGTSRNTSRRRSSLAFACSSPSRISFLSSPCSARLLFRAWSFAAVSWFSLLSRFSSLLRR